MNRNCIHGLKLIQLDSAQVEELINNKNNLGWIYLLYYGSVYSILQRAPNRIRISSFETKQDINRITQLAQKLPTKG